MRQKINKWIGDADGYITCFKEKIKRYKMIEYMYTGVGMLGCYFIYDGHWTLLLKMSFKQTMYGKEGASWVGDKGGHLFCA